MRLVVKQGNHTINEFQFTKGPIYIGRRPSNQICLPDGAVSKQHAVIFNTTDGKWIVEDLDSANKTHLNNRATHKAEIKTGDCIRIIDYTIEIKLKDDTDTPKPSTGEPDTHNPIDSQRISTAATYSEQITARKPGAEDSPSITLSPERAVDFLKATEAISKTDSLDKVLLALLDIITKQFSTYRTWCALRSHPAGPMTCHAGKQHNNQTIQLNDLKLSEKITEAIEEGKFLLFIFPQVPEQQEKEQVHSVLIAPVISLTGCFGVLYAENIFDDDYYSLSDLDYLMILAIHTAAVLKNL